MATLYFTGDEVAFFGGVATQGQSTLFSDITAPFLPTDLVIIEVPDGDIGHGGDFNAPRVGFDCVTVVRDGVAYDFDVAPGSMINQVGPDSTDMEGDTFFATESVVAPPDSGPFAGLDAGQLVFSTASTFATGQDAFFVGITAEDLNSDGDTCDPGEAGNGLFNTTTATAAPPTASSAAPLSTQIMASSPAPCFSSGTRIATPGGDRRVEDLRPGDLVATRDHGEQPIRWVRTWHQDLAGAPPDARPVLLRAGVLGPGLPAQDLIVSPQHRMLAGGAEQLQALWPEEVLVPAKALTAFAGIRHMMGRAAVTWVHFVCDRHEVIRANGCWSESMLLGPEAQQGLSPSDLRELRSMLPPPVDPAFLNGAPARPCLGARAFARGVAPSLSRTGNAA